MEVVAATFRCSSESRQVQSLAKGPGHWVGPLSRASSALTEPSGAVSGRDLD